MPALTNSAWSGAWKSSTPAVELKILSAVLYSPFTLDVVDVGFQQSLVFNKSCSRHFHGLGANRAGWQCRGNARQPTFASHRHYAHAVRNRHPSKSPEDVDSYEVVADDTIDPISENWTQEEKTQRQQKARTQQLRQPKTCSLCDADFYTEEAFDEHLIICYPQHQPGKAPEAVTEDDVRTQEWSIHEETEKLEQVRRLEDELRRARHELHTISQKRQLEHGLRTVLDVYNAVHEKPNRPFSKQDYFNLVDLYFHATQADTAGSPDASPNPTFLEDQPWDVPPAGTEKHVHAVAQPSDGLELLAAVDVKLRKDKIREIQTIEHFVDLLLDPATSYEQLFHAYLKFPSPGIKHLPSATIRTFLQRMSLPPSKTPQNMLRYLSIIDEMQAAKVPISRAEWNAGIHLAGKSFHSVGEEEVRRSLEYWKKMENEAGIRASSATFNILFDVAVKAGQFLLARELFAEMSRRGLRLNRMGRVSHIWSCGKLKNADAVRQAYHDFVEAGEVVDTLVLNTVMVALCNAGEGEAAEQVYERMKSMHTRKQFPHDGDEEIRELFTRYPPPGAQSFGSQMASSHLRRVLIHAPKLRNVASDSYAAIQSRAYLTPDSVTFRTLIAYHAEKTGNLDRLTVLLDDMTRLFNLRLSSMTFLLLFKGFAMNGNTRHSKWSSSRLESVWQVFNTAMKSASAAKPLASAVSVIGKDVSTNQDSSSAGSGSRSGHTLSAQEFFNSTAITSPEHVREGAVTPAAQDVSQEYTERGIMPSDIEVMRSKIFDETPWGRLLKDFAATPEEKEEAELSADPAGRDEPQPFPFQEGSSNETDDYYKIRPSKWLIIWALRAFSTCTRDRRRVEEVYFDVMEHWYKPTDGQRHTVEMVVQNCLNDIDKGIHDKQWWRKKQAYSQSLRPQW